MGHGERLNDIERKLDLIIAYLRWKMPSELTLEDL